MYTYLCMFTPGPGTRAPSRGSKTHLEIYTDLEINTGILEIGVNLVVQSSIIESAILNY